MILVDQIVLMLLWKGKPVILKLWIWDWKFSFQMKAEIFFVDSILKKFWGLHMPIMNFMQLMCSGRPWAYYTHTHTHSWFSNMVDIEKQMSSFSEAYLCGFKGLYITLQILSTLWVCRYFLALRSIGISLNSEILYIFWLLCKTVLWRIIFRPGIILPWLLPTVTSSDVHHHSKKSHIACKVPASCWFFVWLTLFNLKDRGSMLFWNVSWHRRQVSSLQA